MAEKGPYNKTGWERYHYLDPKHDASVPFYSKLDLIFRPYARGVALAQLDRMLKKQRPWDGDGKPTHVHRMKYGDHKIDGTEVPLAESALTIHRKAYPFSREFRLEIDRQQLQTWSYNVLKTLAVDLVQGRVKRPKVTDEVFQRFTDDHDDLDEDHKGKKDSRFRRAAKFSQRYPYEHKPGVSQTALASSVPRPGGIEIMALERESSMPKCTGLSLEKSGKHLMITFGKTKYYLPLESTTKTELECLLISTFKFKAQRLCVDIAVSGDFYDVSLDGAVHISSTLSSTMEKADFLLGAFAFGRDATTGVLFQPKPGQLEGYKNPILETARLLNCDKEYAEVRCRYRDVFLHPTLVCKESFTTPTPSLVDWWPQLDFPKTVFKLVCRLTLVDLSDLPSYYDLPELSKIDPEAEILLRPYKPLIDAFRNHGAEWIASEPDLRKIETTARVFQVLSAARSSGFVMPSLQLAQRAGTSTLTHYRRVEERANFRDPPPDSRESDLVSKALRSALLNEIPKTKDALVRASQYCSLGLMCCKLESYNEGIEYLLKAIEHYNHYTSTEYMATNGLQVCLISVLSVLHRMLINGHDFGWILNKKGEEFPIWWMSLNSVFGPALREFTCVVQELRTQKANAEQAKDAVPLCVEMLIIHLSYATLTWFEQQQDLDGIVTIYEILAHLFIRGTNKNDAKIERWSTVEQALNVLGNQMREWTNKDIIAAQDELTNRDHAGRTEEPLKVQEKLMDLYSLKGEINKAMVCALVAVRMQEEQCALIKDRARILQKAAMIARTARAQKDLNAARAIIGRAEVVLDDRNARRWREDELKIKKSLLISLNDAIRLLHSEDHELEKSAALLMCRARKAVAEVHRENSVVAAKWMIVAQVKKEAAESMNDNHGLDRYAKIWLLDGARPVDNDEVTKALLLLLLRVCLAD